MIEVPKRHWFVLLIAVLSIVLGTVCIIRYGGFSFVETGQKEKGVLVAKVIDGDTIEIAGGRKVRYIGIDAPERVDPRKAVQCFGEEAYKKNKELVEGKRVRLEKDVSETDKYGRLLRYVYVGDIFVNQYLVREGYAYAYTFPPDIKYAEEFVQAQRKAREEKKGLWAACPVPIPSTSTDFDLLPDQGACIGIQETENYVGKYKCVVGRVYKVFTSPSNTTFLDFCEDYRTCPFSVVVFSSDLPNFPNIEQYQGRVVEIEGLIRAYRGRTEIVLVSPDQIKILK